MGKEAGASRERRSNRRIESSIPVRFTADQESYRHGIITSFGEAGLFIQSSELFSLGTKVVIEAPLGAGFGELRWVAKIVYVNRRSGTEVVPGLGVNFDETPESIQRQIAGFMDAYPGAVPLDLEGRFRWSGTGPSRSTTEKLRLSDRLFSVAGLSELVTSLEESEAERVMLLHHRRQLLPEEGFPRALLLELARTALDEASVVPDAPTFEEEDLATFDGEDVMLEEVESGEAVADPEPATEPEAEPATELDAEPVQARPIAEIVMQTLVTQCALVTAFEAADWRLEHLAREPADFLDAVQGLGTLATELADPDADADAGSDWIELAQVLASGLRSAEPHTEAIAWHVNPTIAAGESREQRDERRLHAPGRSPSLVSAGAGDDEAVARHYSWDGARSRARQSRGTLLVGAARDFFAGRARTAGLASLASQRQPMMPRWVEPCLIVTAFLVLPLVATSVWAVDRFEVFGGPKLSSERMAEMQVSPVGEGSSTVELHAWSAADPRKDVYLHEQVKVLAAGGFDSATFSHAGRTVAIWQEGYISAP